MGVLYLLETCASIRSTIKRCIFKSKFFTIEVSLVVIPVSVVRLNTIHNSTTFSLIGTHMQFSIHFAINISSNTTYLLTCIFYNCRNAVISCRGYWKTSQWWGLVLMNVAALLLQEVMFTILPEWTESRTRTWLQTNQMQSIYSAQKMPIAESSAIHSRKQNFCEKRWMTLCSVAYHKKYRAHSLSQIKLADHFNC